jgi:hypothetical protein
MRLFSLGKRRGKKGGGRGVFEDGEGGWKKEEGSRKRKR